MVQLGVPGCRSFVVYPTDKDHPNALHMVSRRALAYNFLYISFCMDEIENVKHIVVSSHFFPQNQNNAKNTSQIACQHKDKTLGHSIKHPLKRNRHTDVVLLHRELHVNLNRHIRHGSALKNVGLLSRVHKISTVVRQKAECPGKPWSFEKQIGGRNSCFEHVGFRISATF